jgi:hypothetical protein
MAATASSLPRPRANEAEHDQNHLTRDLFQAIIGTDHCSTKRWGHASATNMTKPINAPFIQAAQRFASPAKYSCRATRRGFILSECKRLLARFTWGGCSAFIRSKVNIMDIYPAVCFGSNRTIDDINLLVNRVWFLRHQCRR